MFRRKICRTFYNSYLINSCFIFQMLLSSTRLTNCYEMNTNRYMLESVCQFVAFIFSGTIWTEVKVKHGFIWYRLTPRDFNSYGSRRGNDDVMARGTFANIRLVNKLVNQTGARTLHIPTGEEVRYTHACSMLRKSADSNTTLKRFSY